MNLIIREEGVSGLFKGNSSAILLYLGYSSIQFLAYYELEKQLNIASPLWKPFASGSLAGATATFATYPLDLLRTRFAAQGHQHQIYNSIIDSIRIIHQREGIPGFYRGVISAMIQIIPYTGLIFSTYSLTRDKIESVVLIVGKDGTGHKKWIDLVSGGIAGMISKAIVLPFDVVRYGVFVMLMSGNACKSKDQAGKNTQSPKFPRYRLVGHGWELQRTLQRPRES